MTGVKRAVEQAVHHAHMHLGLACVKQIDTAAFSFIALGGK